MVLRDILDKSKKYFSEAIARAEQAAFGCSVIGLFKHQPLRAVIVFWICRNKAPRWRRRALRRSAWALSCRSCGLRTMIHARSAALAIPHNHSNAQTIVTAALPMDRHCAHWRPLRHIWDNFSVTL